MDCHDLDRILNDHAMAALSRAERSALEEHLRGCSRCQPLWQAHEQLMGGPMPTTPPELLDRVLDRVDRTADGLAPETAVGRGWWRKAAVPFGLAAAAGLVSIWLWQSGGRDTGASSADAEVAIAAAEQPDQADRVDPGAASAALGRPGAAGSAAARRFVEGVHYRRLPAPAGGPGATQPGGADARFAEPSSAAGPDSAQVVVEEFFMYGCPHCYTFEGLFGPWCEVQPDYVNVVRVPVVFNPIAALHARAFYAARLLGIDSRTHDAMLAAIHERGQPLSTESELARFAARFGIAEATYLETLHSPEVAARVEAAAARSRALGIRATPTVVVDGRYEVAPGLSGSYEDMLAVTDQLIEQIDEERSDLYSDVCKATDEPGTLNC